MRLILLAALTLVSLNAVADRSVSIAVPDGKLQLVNGSGVAVNYTVECFDKNTGANVMTGTANQTLAAKASRDFLSGGTCANGATPTYTSQGVIACPASTNLSNSANVCTTSSPICTFADLSAKSVTDLSSFPDGYWFKTNVDPYWMTYDNWGKSYQQSPTSPGKYYQPRTYPKGGVSNRCNTTNSMGTSFAGIGGCANGDNYQTLNGSLCCSTNSGFKSCKVTILSSTPAAGHLQSPQFKGGASF